MYAAAGGASIASRQARQKQKLQSKNKALAANQKAAQQSASKLLAAGAKGASHTASKMNLNQPSQSKQFHNLPSTYYNQNQVAGVVKSKSGVAERGTLRPPHQTHRRNSSNVHGHMRASETSGQLTKSCSTAKIHHSQSCMFPSESSKDIDVSLARNHRLLPNSLPVSNHLQQPSEHSIPTINVPEPPKRVDSIDATSTDVATHDDDAKPLERRCSVRHQRAQEVEDNQKNMSYDNQLNQQSRLEYDEDRPVWDLNPPMYGDIKERYADFGSMDFPFSECSQGRAAWQERERERRGSLTEAALNSRVRQTEAHLRWMKRNRIHDSSYGGSSDDEDILGGLYGHQSAAANALLYVGLGTVAIGAVIFFVGTGEKGFKTLELRLIGPSLVGCGLLCCLVRILLCACPSRCFRRRKRKRCRHGGGSRRYRDTSEDFHMADHNTSLLRKHTNKKRVSIAPTKPVPSTSQCNNIATTSLFLQNEQEKNTVPKRIPTIAVPHLVEVDDGDGPSGFNRSDGRAPTTASGMAKTDSIIELQCLEHDNFDDVSSVSSDDNVVDNAPTNTDNRKKTTVLNVEQPVNTKVQSKINRKREPLNVQQRTTSRPKIMETSLTTPILNDGKPFSPANQTPETSSGVQSHDSKRNPACTARPHGEIVLSPSKLGQ